MPPAHLIAQHMAPQVAEADESDICEHGFRSKVATLYCNCGMRCSVLSCDKREDAGSTCIRKQKKPVTRLFYLM